MKRISLLTIFTFVIACAFAQKTASFKAKKKGDVVFFYQVSDKCDSIYSDECNKFYLFMNDSMKPHIQIRIENGQLVKTKNDSIVTLNYLPGLKYEVGFEQRDSAIFVGGKKKPTKMKKVWVFAPGIDGATDYNKKRIRIVFYDKRREKAILENIFYPRN